jgi:hypothetical protein
MPPGRGSGAEIEFARVQLRLGRRGATTPTPLVGLTRFRGLLSLGVLPLERSLDAACASTRRILPYPHPWSSTSVCGSTGPPPATHDTTQAPTTTSTGNPTPRVAPSCLVTPSHDDASDRCSGRVTWFWSECATSMNRECSLGGAPSSYAAWASGGSSSTPSCSRRYCRMSDDSIARA